MRALNWWDFQFETRQIPAISSAGTPYLKRVWWGMPQLPPPTLKCVFYLYHSVEDAKAGKPEGATGFLVGIQAQHNPSAVYPVAVTNWHAAVRSGASVVRVNKIAGGFDIFDLGPHDWLFEPGGHDLAVARLPLDAAIHDMVALSSNMFLSHEAMEMHEINAGEDVYLVGRFVDHAGIEKNVPAARFGHISMMPDGNIEQPNGSRLPSFCVDMNSRTGFSGSPVFVYRTIGQQVGHVSLNANQTFIYLLGIHWGQFPERWELRDKPRETAKEESLILDGKYVKGMSGMTCVIPAWEIWRLLELSGEVSYARAMEAASMANPKNPQIPVAETAESEPPTTEGDEQHRERFTSLLDAVARKRPPAGQT